MPDIDWFERLSNTEKAYFICKNSPRFPKGFGEVATDLELDIYMDFFRLLMKDGVIKKDA